MSDAAIHAGETDPTTFSDIPPTFEGLLRAYKRLLQRRPTTLQYQAMQRAARAATRYDRALGDDSLTGTTLAHYERVSRKAYAAMLESFKRPASAPPPLWGRS